MFEYFFTKRWLRAGKKTQITSSIKNLVSKFTGTYENKALAMSNFIKKYRKEVHEIFRMRSRFEPTANDILARGAKGCTQKATLFRAMCIANNIPAIFVETINKDWIKLKPTKEVEKVLIAFKKEHKKVDIKNWKLWLQSKNIEKSILDYIEKNKKNLYTISGHFFVDVFIDKKWYTINPGKAKLYKRGDYFIKGMGKYVPIYKGLDIEDFPYAEKDFRKIIAKKYNKKWLI